MRNENTALENLLVGKVFIVETTKKMMKRMMKMMMDEIDIGIIESTEALSDRSKSLR